MGIMYLSSVLKKAGHAVSLTDQCHPLYSDEKFVSSLSEERPDMVGISFLSNMCYPSAKALSRKIKDALPAVRIVYGGVFSTVNAREIVGSEHSVDVVARGEGEGIVLDLAERPGQLSDIPGITFRSKTGEVIETPDRLGIADLDSIPFPDRDSLDIDYVAALPLDVPALIWDLPYTALVSSRGCPFGCTYCNCPTFSYHKCRFRSVGNILQELADIERRGCRAFIFLDDNFLLNASRVKEICAGMKERGHSFQWACEGRVDAGKNNIFGDLAEAGCDMVMFGIESGSQRVLDSLNKRTTLSAIEKAVAQSKEAGIGTRHGFFIVGSPGETVDEMRQTFAFASRLPINSFAFNSLTAFRGTPLWQEAVEKGYIDEEKDWDKMFPVHAIFPNTIDSKTLFSLRSKLVKRMIVKKALRHPLEATRVFMRFLRGMSVRELFRLLFCSSRKDHTQTRK